MWNNLRSLSWPCAGSHLCESTFLHELSASATRVHAATNCNENYGTPDRVGTVGKMSYKEISLPHEVSRPGGPGRQSLPFAEPFAWRNTAWRRPPNGRSTESAGIVHVMQWDAVKPVFQGSDNTHDGISVKVVLHWSICISLLSVAFTLPDGEHMLVQCHCVLTEIVWNRFPVTCQLILSFPLCRL